MPLAYSFRVFPVRPFDWIIRCPSLAVVLSFCLACFLHGTLDAAPAAGDYWMFVGTDTTDFVPRDSEGIYLFKFHSADGTTQAAGLAAERVPQIFAQLRSRWFFTTAMLHGVQNPRVLAVHPNGRYLYTADTNILGTVSAYQIERNTGRLTLLNVKPSGGAYATFVTVDHTGKYILVTNSIGSVAVLPINSDGRLRDPSSLVEYHGSGPYRSIIPRAHSVNLSPDNRFAIVLDTIMDEILLYRFDSNGGTITPNDPPTLRTTRGAAFRELSFHPNGASCYVIGESSTIATFGWDRARGVLTPVASVSTLPPDYHRPSGAGDVQVHASGKFLYVSNRGHDSIAVFTIDPVNGTLKPIQYEPTQGQRPRSFCIDPTGRYLFVGNSLSGSVVEFQIDQQTGRLTRTEPSFRAPKAESIKFAPAP
jgi:6-phosphogluconolactonase